MEINVFWTDIARIQLEEIFDYYKENKAKYFIAGRPDNLPVLLAQPSQAGNAGHGLE
ncbi:hypothetical protein ACFLSA_04210 [Bacteroidota bacterium]